MSSYGTWMKVLSLGILQVQVHMPKIRITFQLGLVKYLYLAMHLTMEICPVFLKFLFTVEALNCSNCDISLLH